jgi:alpha-L-arabinofuranosidase
MLRKRGYSLSLAISAAMLLSGLTTAAYADATLNIDAAHPSHAIPPTLCGLMTEEISHSYDGGLYAELIQNRSFKNDPKNPAHWSLIQNNGGVGSISLDKENPLNSAQDTSLKITATTANGASEVGVANDGYWGIPVKPRTQYHLSFYARGSVDFSGPLSVRIESADGSTVYASAKIKGIKDGWAQYTATLKTSKNISPTASARFVISVSSPGSVWLDLVSLFPPTYNKRANGNRIDIMNLLKDMHPSFLRFPGGNYVEGNNVEGRYDWKKTIGDVSLRPGHPSPWGYRSTDGMGLLEFLEWCEDLHMDPLLAVFAGYTLDGKSMTGADLDQCVQDGLDEIGNEDFPAAAAATYEKRFSLFYDAFKAKYPNIKLIATISVKSRKPDIVDDHYYQSSRDLERTSAHYTKWPAEKTRVFVGEWATQNPGANPWAPQTGKDSGGTPAMRDAVSDAAFMVGMERDSDAVLLHCYAPLFVNVNKGARQWSPNLIGYDALTAYGSPSYYAQVMYSSNRGDVALPVALTQPKAPEPPLPAGEIGVGSWNTGVEYKDIKVTSGDKVLYSFDPAKPDYRGGSDDWAVENGALTYIPSGGFGGFPGFGRRNSNPMMGDRSWTDYSLTMKARKTEGSEGFLIIFHAKSDNDYRSWNIGGWRNAGSEIDYQSPDNRGSLSERTPFSVETDRWYDIRVDVKGRDVKCYIDGQLVASTTDNGDPKTDTVFATASRESKTGDVIIKAVNADSIPQPLHVTIDGDIKVNSTAKLTQLSGTLTDTNSISEPEKVKPVDTVIDNASNDFTQTLPANSVNLIRLSTK